MEKETPTPRNKSRRLKISLKLYYEDGQTFTYHTSKTKRIYSIIRHQDFSEALLKIDYGGGLTNSGTYNTKGDLIFALAAFTERSLAEYLWG